jgi:NAD(P)-dependent dehydrogenase (short-subunit alcohol dehydrogenase family)
MGRLQHRVAIVTGAARGIGAATAAALAAEGATVVLADKWAEAAAEAAQGIVAAGGAGWSTPLDVSDAGGWAALVAAVLQRHGRIDCLVNNAGVDAAATIETATAEAFRGMFEINVMGAFHGMQAVIPSMKRQGGGSIVNIASLGTHKVAPTSTLYSPTKAALASLTKACAVHCAQQGYRIRVNSVHPGPIKTAMLLGDDAARAESADIKQLIGMIPLGCMGEPADVGAAVVFLACDDSRYITAAELFVDGGLAAV